MTPADLIAALEQAEGCNHEWQTSSGGWGVILGVSRCKTCGKLAEQSDFAALRARETGNA